MPGSEAPLARAGRRMADTCERYFPDAFVFALGGVLLVFLAGLLAGGSPLKLVTEFGDGVWVLVPFPMPMALVVVTGFGVATSAPVPRPIGVLPPLPKSA